jgi:hypothetical protein
MVHLLGPLAGGLVEEGLRRVEGRVTRRGLVEFRAALHARPTGILHRVDGVHLVAFVLVLHPGRLGDVDEAAAEVDDAAGEVAVGQLVVLPVDGHGGVAAHATADAHGEGSAQRRLVEVAR